MSLWPVLVSPQSPAGDQFRTRVQLCGIGVQATASKQMTVHAILFAAIHYDLFQFYYFVTNRYDFVTTPIRFMRPDFALVFSSFLYIEGETWSDETDRNRNLSYNSLRFRYNFQFRYDSLRYTNLVTISLLLQSVSSDHFSPLFFLHCYILKAKRGRMKQIRKKNLSSLLRFVTILRFRYDLLRFRSFSSDQVRPCFFVIVIHPLISNFHNGRNILNTLVVRKHISVQACKFLKKKHTITKNKQNTKKII